MTSTSHMIHAPGYPQILPPYRYLHVLVRKHDKIGTRYTLKPHPELLSPRTARSDLVDYPGPGWSGGHDHRGPGDGRKADHSPPTFYLAG